MAIDTDNEKFALITYQQPFNTPIPSSNDGLGQGDKQHLIWQYPGILWLAIGVEISFVVEQERRDFVTEQEGRNFVTEQEGRNFVAEKY